VNTSPELVEAQERVRRFERMGGVPLGNLEPEEKHDLLAEVRTGIAKYKRTIFRYRCPMCGNVVTNDQEMPPACTGPGWQDVHPIEPMELIHE
jgi:lipopolysaccharide biosynthesis regulator YciM